jgi:hypothetical protein
MLGVMNKTEGFCRGAKTIYIAILGYGPFRPANNLTPLHLMTYFNAAKKGFHIFKRTFK